MDRLYALVLFRYEVNTIELRNWCEMEVRPANRKVGKYETNPGK